MTEVAEDAPEAAAESNALAAPVKGSSAPASAEPSSLDDIFS